MEYFYIVAVFFFGGALGSFILVVADRYNTGLPFLKGRSICFSCGTRLEWRDMFPIFSYLFLRGRCRRCGSKIPRGSFWAEIVMGVLVVLAAFMSGLLSFSVIFDSHSIFHFFILTSIFAVLLLITVYDLRHFIIPDSFLIFLFVFSLISVIFDSRSIIQHFFSALVVTLPFFTIFLVSRGRWLGFGDVKYIAVLGFLLGLSAGLSAVILSFWIGAVFSIVALLIHKISPKIHLPLFRNNLTIKSEIPFGPFLSLGAIISLFLNPDIFKINEIFNFF